MQKTFNANAKEYKIRHNIILSKNYKLITLF